MPNQTVKNGRKAKKIELPQMNFFSQKTTNIIFMYLLAPFIAQKQPIYPEQKIFGTNHYYFHLPIDPFHCAKFKNILTADPEL